MVGSRLAKRARSGHLSTAGLIGEIMPKAEITVSQPTDLSRDRSCYVRNQGDSGQSGRSEHMKTARFTGSKASVPECVRHSY